MTKMLSAGLAGIALAFAISATAQAQVTVHRNLAYSDRSERNVLDLYLPDGIESPPIVVWIHGGGWEEGSKDAVIGYKSMLDAGIGIAAMNYRFCPDHIWPAQLEDMGDAFAFLRAHAEEYGLDGTRLAVMGHSAGAHLAAVAGLAFAADPETRLIASVVYGGPTDFLADEDDRIAYAKGLGLSRPPAARANAAESCLIGAPVADNPELAFAASPFAYLEALPADVEVPAFLFLHGARDSTVVPYQAARLFDALMARIPDAELGFILVPNARHQGFGLENADRMDQVAAFLKRNFER